MAFEEKKKEEKDGWGMQVMQSSLTGGAGYVWCLSEPVLHVQSIMLILNL